MKKSTLVLLTKMKSKALCFSLLLVVLLNANLKGETVSYLLEITDGLAHTSGGFSGTGRGDVIIDGTFKLHIDHGINYAALENVDIDLIVGDFDWSDLEGTINGTAISLSFTSPFNGLDHHLGGTFDGNTAFLQGTVRDEYYDGYQYDCEITAVVIESCGYLLGGDLNDDCAVELRDFG